MAQAKPRNYHMNITFQDIVMLSIGSCKKSCDEKYVIKQPNYSNISTIYTESTTELLHSIQLDARFPSTQCHIKSVYQLAFATDHKDMTNTPLGSPICMA